jgi:hypothetical protein
MRLLAGGLDKFQFATFFVLTSLLLSSICLAAGEVTVSVDKKSITMYTGESTSVQITVQNNQEFMDSFSVTRFPSNLNGIITTLQSSTIDLNYNSVGSVKLTFDSAECAEETSSTFTVTVQSNTNSDVQESTNVNINTIRKYPVCISDVVLNTSVLNPGDTLQINTLITNPSDSNSLPISIQTNINSVNETIQSFYDRIETVAGKETAIVSRTYTFSNYTKPGFYYVNVMMKDNFNNVVSTKTTSLRITSVENKIVTTKNVKWGFFTQTVEITAKNEGNVPSKSFFVTETIPIFMKVFFIPKVEPTSQETIGTRVVYSWLVDSLNPGEEKTITYEISTWDALLILLALIAVVIYSFQYIYKISVIKKHRYTGPLTKDREIVISLEVRNRTRHHLKDIFVRDFVPSIATVVERFDTLKPTLRKVTGGTEIVWKLDSLRPLEDRVVSYRVKPTMDIIGSLKLPRASIRYMDKNKQLKKVISKSIKIRSR